METEEEAAVERRVEEESELVAKEVGSLRWKWMKQTGTGEGRGEEG